MKEVRQFYQQTFGRPPVHVAQAPGRLEILGNHTDYNQGLVMSAAVDRMIYMASGARTDGQIELASAAFAGREKFYLDRIERSAGSAAWANYVKGVLAELRNAGVHFTGFNAAIWGTLPVGAGMSSSAALELATALTVWKLHPFLFEPQGKPVHRSDAAPPSTWKNREKMFLAKLCRAAEHAFVGVNCGILDQVSSLFGRNGHVLEIDCLHETVETVPWPAGLALVVCDSGVKHALAEGDYNELREHCERAARGLNVPSLRFADDKLLEKNRSRLAVREYECAYHIIGENRRVRSAERALREDDPIQFGQFFFESHSSSRDFFRNSCPELDALVLLAQAQPSCLGARLTGGGFGGATLNLVRHDQAERFISEMQRGYERQCRRKLEAFICKIADGAA